MENIVPASVWEQIPVIAVFSVLAYFAFREFRATLRDVVAQQQAFFAEQRKQDREILSSLVDKVEEIGNNLETHDKITREAIIEMKTTVAEREKTRPSTGRKTSQ